MSKAEFEKALKDFVKDSPGNSIQKETAIRPDLAGIRMYEEPIIGYVSAEDTFWEEAKKPSIIGEHFMTPTEWLPGAKTVIAFFLPFTLEIRLPHRANMDWPADEWLNARFEGNIFQNKICSFLEDFFKSKGFNAVAPMINSRFLQGPGYPFEEDKSKDEANTSNWSERHIAWAAGIGTFGLSKGLISRKGVAGRYTSIITEAFFEPDSRQPYTGIHDFCSVCGACIRKCPVGAISQEKGKIKSICYDRGRVIRGKMIPYSGCGKCQVGVPCEDKLPVRSRKGLV